MSHPRHRLFVGKDRHKFSAAHMTVFPDGTKERLHGHNFYVTAALELTDIAFERFCDFGPVKKVLAELCDAWDERVLLAEANPFFYIVSRSGGSMDFTLCGQRYVVPMDEVVLLPIDNVTVEALAWELGRRFAARITALVPGELVHRVEVEVAESRGQGGLYSQKLKTG
jgi:6-pyruvoyltetrahydropterin/6-carboxytetrahydropterin synthase